MFTPIFTFGFHNVHLSISSGMQFEDSAPFKHSVTKLYGIWILLLLKYAKINYMTSSKAKLAHFPADLHWSVPGSVPFPLVNSQYIDWSPTCIMCRLFLLTLAEVIFYV